MPNKVVVIVGGSDGCGKAIAKYIKSKHTVVITSPNKSKLTQVASELGVDSVVGDITDFNQCEVIMNKVMAKYGRIDCVINSAGLWIQNELFDNDPDTIQQVVEVNLLGAIYISKAAISVMKKRKQGLIVHINSQAGFYAKAERSVYNATKWGLTGFVKSIQPELAQYGIAVTDIHPGKMKTEMFSKMGFEKSMDNGLDPSNVGKFVSFLLELDSEVCVPEIGIKHILN